MLRNACGSPVRVTVVPPAADPDPRSTTPLAPMASGTDDENIPGPSTTAPRKPPDSDRFDTVSMAAWMAAVSSPPEGFTATAIGTVGSATPPPMYPACE